MQANAEQCLAGLTDMRTVRNVYVRTYRTYRDVGLLKVTNCYYRAISFSLSVVFERKV